VSTHSPGSEMSAFPPTGAAETRSHVPSSSFLAVAPSYSFGESEPSEGSTSSAASRQTVRRMARLLTEGETRTHDTRSRAATFSLVPRYRLALLCWCQGRTG